MLGRGGRKIFGAASPRASGDYPEASFDAVLFIAE